MRWLADCAQRVSKDNKAVQWQSPIGVPIVQPYYQARKKVVNTVLQVGGQHQRPNLSPQWSAGGMPCGRCAA
jgi:DNA-directed RNA polymerase